MKRTLMMVMTGAAALFGQAAQADSVTVFEDGSISIVRELADGSTRVSSVTPEGMRGDTVLIFRTSKPAVIASEPLAADKGYEMTPHQVEELVEATSFGGKITPIERVFTLGAR